MTMTDFRDLRPPPIQMHSSVTSQKQDLDVILDKRNVLLELLKHTKHSTMKRVK